MNVNPIPTQSKQWLARRQARTNHTYLSCRFQLLTLSPLWWPRKFYLLRPFQRPAISTVSPFLGSSTPIPTPASLPQVSHTLAIFSPKVGANNALVPMNVNTCGTQQTSKNFPHLTHFNSARYSPPPPSIHIQFLPLFNPTPEPHHKSSVLEASITADRRRKPTTNH